MIFTNFNSVQILDTDRSGSVSFEEFNEALKFGLLNGILAEAAQNEKPEADVPAGRGNTYIAYLLKRFTHELFGKTSILTYLSRSQLPIT